MRRTRRTLPKDDGYGCGTAAVGLLIIMLGIAAGLSFCGWEP